MKRGIKRYVLTAAALLASASFVAGTLFYTQSKLYAQPSLIPILGGRVNDLQICCNGIMYTIGPPKGGLYLADSNTRFYLWYQILRKHVWFLGKYNRGGQCVLPPKCKAGVPVNGTITDVGTSLLPQ